MSGVLDEGESGSIIGNIMRYGSNRGEGQGEGATGVMKISRRKRMKCVEVRRVKEG